MKKRTTRGINQDRARRSSEGHETGRKAPKKGNPRYVLCDVKVKSGPQKGMTVKRRCRRDE